MTEKPTEMTGTHLTKIITLDNPIKRGDQVITEVTLRKPDAGTLRGTKLVDILQGDFDAHMKIMPRITDPILLAPELERMAPEDFSEMIAGLMGFFMTKEQRRII